MLAPLTVHDPDDSPAFLSGVGKLHPASYYDCILLRACRRKAHDGVRVDSLTWRRQHYSPLAIFTDRREADSPNFLTIREHVSGQAHKISQIVLIVNTLFQRFVFALTEQIKTVEHFVYY